MELRFAPIPDSAKPADRICTCDSCGFVGRLRFQIHEEEGREVVSCDMCFAARHVGEHNVGFGKKYELTWAPEISQQSLGLMIRTMAFARLLVVKRSDRIEKNSALVMTELRARSAKLMAALDHPPENLFDLWPQFPKSTRTALLKGMRLFRNEFDMDDAEDWSHDGASFAGFDLEAVEENKWFVEAVDPALAETFAREFEKAVAK